MIRWAYRFGVVTQGLVLGFFLSLALLKLLSLAIDARVFRYQGF